MKRKIFDWKRGVSAMAVLLVTAGVMFGASNAKAADIANTRGRVTVDLEDFVLVESTISDTDDFGLVSQNSSNSRYLLHYENSFTDRNNIGCTFRSSSKYDLTDVTAMQMYAYSQQEANDKILFYVDSGSKTYYHRKDLDDVTSSLVSGSGTVKDISYFCYSAYGKTPQDYKFNINSRYTSEYVYLGISHEWWMHNAKLYLDNKTISGGTQGCINLMLKKHNITLLAPDDLTQYVVDDNGNTVEKTFSSWGEMKLALEDGKKYDENKTGSIYRDETATLLYNAADGCSLKSFKFYSDADKKNLLYEMNVEGADNQCTFKLTSSLIQTLEKKTGPYKLENIYVQPVFSLPEVTVDFSNVVAEAKNEVEVVKASTNNDGTKTYNLCEKATSKVIGTFTMNQASHRGDYLTLDYTPNKDYTGDFAFNYYEYRIAESSNQINGAAKSTAEYSESKMDLVVNLSDTYIQVSAHVTLSVTVTLKDKTVTFNNYPQEIDEAVIEYNDENGRVAPTGEITYQYYTDEACTTKVKDSEGKDTAPTDAGTYYVTATFAGSGKFGAYKETVSAPAKLIIEKAVPTLENLVGTSIEYGDNILESTPSGKAYGVLGKSSPLTGTFKWASETGRTPDAGVITETVIFTPDSVWATNYTTATGDARVKVEQVSPKIKANNVTKIFDGESVTSVPVTVTGVNNEATGQDVSYTFYSGAECTTTQKMDEVPVNAGIYYAKAYASPNTNYKGISTKEPAVIVIKKRECDLVQAPLENQSYRVYVTNVVAGNAPQGTITLQILVNGEVKGSVSGLTISEENGKYFASYTYGSISEYAGDATEFVVKASYEEATDAVENYTINDSELAVDVNSDGTGSVVTHERITLDYGTTTKVDVTECQAIQNAQAEEQLKNLKVRYLNLAKVNAGEIVTVNASDQDSSVFEVTGNDVGTATVAVCVQAETASGTTKIWYVFYECVVNPISVNISLADKIAVYSGNPVEANVAAVDYADKNGESEVTASYKYYTDEACETEIKDADGNNVAPVNVGTYYVKATTASWEKHQAASEVATITITPAEPVITIVDKTVTYDGEHQGLAEPVVAGVAGGDEEDERRTPTGSVALYYESEKLDYHSYEEPVDAGTYTVKAIYESGENDNYAQQNAPTATLIINPAECTIELQAKEATYTGEPVAIDAPVIKDVNGNSIDTASVVIKYCLSTETKYTEQAPTEAGLYEVYAYCPAGGNYQEAYSETVTLWIKPADITVNLSDAETTYTGEAVDMSVLSPTTVTGVGQTDITEDTIVEYQYYEDENAMVKVDEPVNAGTYYVKAVADESRNYNGGESSVCKLTIQKAVPVLSGLTMTELTYGDELSESKISGTATGVEKDGKLSGEFYLEEAISHVRCESGIHEVAVTFVPGSDDARNYTEASGTATVTVKPYTPSIEGKDTTVVYCGEAVTIDAVNVVGADGMPEPVGTVQYDYYTDAGKYTCDVTFVSETGNYTNATASYQLTVKKADAIIALYLPEEWKNLENKTITIEGTISGVFDDPTGTITLYKKVSGEDADKYVAVAEGVAIVKNEDGDYGFNVSGVGVELNQAYDFKAVYNEGEKQNYNIADGEMENVELEKDSQYIYFEEKIVKTTYGAEDFQVNVLEGENNGDGAITYQLVKRFGDSNAISVKENGTISVQDLGTAFVLAKKAGDATHNPAYAVLVIKVEQAATEVSLADKTVTYSGEAVAIDEAIVTSNSKEIAADENIEVTYTYKNVATGDVFDFAPTDAGEYEVEARSVANEHYLASEPATAKLIIEKVPAFITLKVSATDEVNKTVTLQGIVEGVFDDPTGTIALSQKKDGESDSEYVVVAEGIEIVVNEDGSYGFEVTADVKLNTVYTFKASYEEGIRQNYTVTAYELDKVVVEGEEEDPDNPGGGSDNGKDDGSNGGKDNSSGDGKAAGVDTNDTNSIFVYVLIMIASMATTIITRKRVRR